VAELMVPADAEPVTLSGAPASPRRRLASRVALVLLGGLFLVVALAPVLPLADPNDQDLSNALREPVLFGGTWDHLLGTDQLGRDMLARMVFGARLSFFIAVVGVACAGVLGSALGIAAGFLGRSVDFVVSRLVEAQLALPFLLLAVALIVTRGQSLAALMFVLVTYGWAEYARVVRAEVMSLRGRPFVLGLRVAGASRLRIMARHILPNVFNTIFVVATLQVGFMVLGESALSFLGLGVVAPDVSWGAMLADGRSEFTRAWWVGVLPGVAIFLFVLTVNLTGDALRRRHDPRRRAYA
jgi:peptide/nickel transport system permease protein